MATVTKELTKADEIRIYRDFVESLQPGSYLAMILEGSVSEIDYQIRNDFAIHGTMAVLIGKRVDADRQLRDVQAAVRAAQAELRKEEQRLDMTREVASGLRSRIQTAVERVTENLRCI